jgi:hypothetical protein
MADTNFLPNGHDDVSFGKVSTQNAILRGLTCSSLQDILEAVDYKSNEFIEDGAEEIYLKCQIGGLNFTAAIIDNGESVVTHRDVAGTHIHLQSAYELAVSDEVELDVWEMVNTWNRSELITRSTTDGEAVFLDLLIPCDGVDSGYLTSALFDWFHMNQEFIDFVIASSAPKGDEDESSDQ